MRKIAIVSWSISGGGSERFSTILANGLTDREYEVHLLTGPVVDNEYHIKKNVLRRVLFKKISLLGNTYKLRKYLVGNCIDICIAVGLYPNFIAALSNIYLKTRVVLSERNAPNEDKLSVKSKLLRKLLYWRGDAFVFQTLDAKSFYGKKIQRRGFVIPNPIKEGLPKRTDVVQHELVAVGRLEPQKNYPLLLESFSEVSKLHPEYTLRIFGKGSMEIELRKQVDKLQLNDKVVFEGFSTDIHEKIKECDIFVLSSDFEGLPNALMEAMTMGFPVVSTDCPCGGPKMLIKNGENGILVPVGNREKLSEAIISYIENPALKTNCAREALFTSKKYELGNIIDEWELLFQNLL